MMLAEQQPLLPVELRILGLERVGEQRLLKELLPQPQWQRHAKRREAARTVGEVGLQQALELDERLVVEHDPVDIPERDAGLAQAIVGRAMRKPGIELLAGEAFLLRGRDHAAILDEGSS